MDDTTRLALPLVAPAQAQKHVTVNEAFTRLDGLVQGAVMGIASAPPGSPEEGECWIVGAAPTGAWQGWAGDLAMFASGGWLRLEAREGWRVWDRDAQTMRLRASAGWVPMADVLGDLGALGLETGAVTGLGINAAVDAVNRFVFDGTNMLFTSPAGSIDATLNKAAPGGDASVSFKTGYSARALAGLLGDDDFTIKVSPDGATWHPALVVKHGSGEAELLAGARIGGHAALHRGNVLGTVGESGGMPTGAVIERGSNANGDYVRWADGTQICTSTRPAVAVAAVAGGIFMHQNLLSWSFPAAFAARPVVCGDAGNAARWIAPSAATPANAGFRVYSYGSSASESSLNLAAIGRWH